MTRFGALVRRGAVAVLTLAGMALGTPVLAADYTAGFRYDALHRVVGTIDPDPDGAGPLPFGAVRYSWSDDGQLTLVEKGTLSAWQAATVAPSAWGAAFTVQQKSAFSYDARGMQTEARVAVGGTPYSVTQYSYDADGRLTCQAVRMNMAAIPAAGSGACVPGTAGSNGKDRITKTIYDVAGQTLQLRKAVGVAGLEQAYATYAYSANGKPVAMVDANGNRAELDYDEFDRQDRWTFPSATRPPSFDPATPASALATAGAVNAADYEQYGYDANDNRTSLRKRDARTLTFAYDKLNRMSSKTVPDACVAGYACTTPPASATRDVFYGYDLRGLQTDARFVSITGDGLTSTYDKAGRLTAATMVMDGTSRQLSYGYDANSVRNRLTFPDVVTVAFSFSQDAAGRMTGLYEGAALNSRQTEITYDASGQRMSLNRTPGQTTAYLYDPISRLKTLTHGLVGGNGNVATELSYNPASQIISRMRDSHSYAYTNSLTVTRPYTVNGLNQYTAAGPASFSYDANGNLITTPDEDGDTITYTYDAENRLVAASGGRTATLTYDPLGRLYETTGVINGTTRFLYDGDALVAEYDASGNLLRRYVHGSGVDEPLVWYEGDAISTATRRFLHADHQGSVVAVSNASGALMQPNSYDEYGMPGASNMGRFQYTGQIMIPELGLYHYKARAYSPMLGRFLQTDPIGYADQNNLYAYVGNDPVNGRDPSGRQSIQRRNDDKIVVVVYPQRTHDHVDARHGPEGSAPNIYANAMTKSEGEALATQTMADSMASGTAERQGVSSVYESNQSGWLSDLGSKGEETNRVVTIPLTEIKDDKMRMSAKDELDRPEVIAGVVAARAAQQKEGITPKPVEVEVIVTQYPVDDPK